MSGSGHAFLCLLAATAVIGCARSERRQQDTNWQRVAEARMTPAQIAQRDDALAARDSLFHALKGRLTAVVGSEGPAAAIEVCAREAPDIAQRVSTAHDLAIGRTSFRLRNPSNAPPEWAAPLIAERVVEPTYLARSGELAALLPIRLQPECLICHGKAEEVPPDVAEAIAERYPRDEATGFRSGELRGWFWVDVPPRDAP